MWAQEDRKHFKLHYMHILWDVISNIEQWSKEVRVEFGKVRKIITSGVVYGGTGSMAAGQLSPILFGAGQYPQPVGMRVKNWQHSFTSMLLFRQEDRHTKINEIHGHARSSVFVFLSPICACICGSSWTSKVMSKLLYHTFHEDVITNTCPKHNTGLANICKEERLKRK